MTLLIPLALLALLALICAYLSLGAAARMGDEQLEGIERENWSWPDRVDEAGMQRYEQWRADQARKEWSTNGKR